MPFASIRDGRTDVTPTGCPCGREYRQKATRALVTQVGGPVSEHEPLPIVHGLSMADRKTGAPGPLRALRATARQMHSRAIAP
jgi:hypothetical protein